MEWDGVVVLVWLLDFLAFFEYITVMKFISKANIGIFDKQEGEQLS